MCRNIALSIDATGAQPDRTGSPTCRQRWPFAEQDETLRDQLHRLQGIDAKPLRPIVSTVPLLLDPHAFWERGLGDRSQQR